MVVDVDVDDEVEVELVEPDVVVDEEVDVEVVLSVVEVLARVVVVNGISVVVVMSSKVRVVEAGDVFVAGSSVVTERGAGSSPMPTASRIDCMARSASIADRSGAGSRAPERLAVAVKATTTPRVTRGPPALPRGASQGRSARPVRGPAAHRSRRTLMCIKARTTVGSKEEPDNSPIWRRAAA